MDLDFSKVGKMMDRKTFLSEWFSECEGKIEIRVLPSGKQKFFSPDDHPGIDAFAKKHGGLDIYFGVATRNGAGGAKANITSIPGAWADIDFKNIPQKEADKLLAECPLRPTFIINSGGGYHPYWRLREPTDNIQIVEHINRQLAQYFNSDPVHNADRILRLPNTFNYKYDPARPVSITLCSPKTQYNESDFEEHFPALKHTTESSGRNSPGWQDEALQPKVPGKRHHTAAQLAGRHIEKGLSNQEILPILRDWDKRNTPPIEKDYPEGELLKIIESIRKTHDRNHPQTSKVNLTENVAARVREYLLDEFDGGVFKISDLRRELGLGDNAYTVARNCVKRMVDQDLVQKHGHQLGCYRVVDRKKKTINWAETEAQASNLILPGGLHKIATIRSGDIIAIAGFKNHNKTGMAIETIRLNLDNFKIHFFITEYKARMKRRLLDFGIDLNHPNFNGYQMDKTDYIPDKIESGPGVLNVIDHLPNLDNFWLVGKYQDEIHRVLDGAICMITHQKLKPNDIDAIGKSFWRITPTLAVTLFWDDTNEYQGKMKIVKAKEPGEGQTKVYGLTLEYSLKHGREFKYNLEGWK